MNKYKKIITVISLFSTLLVLNTAKAVWAPPPAGTIPPGNNTPAPINVSSSYQKKIGPLGIDSSLGVVDMIRSMRSVVAPKFCLNNTGQDDATGNCITSWPTGGGTAGVTAIYPGTGITLSGNTGNVTISSTGGTNYWTSNGAGAIFNNTGTTIGINTNAPYTGSGITINGSGKNHGLYTYGAGYGVVANGSTGIYGSGYIGLFGYGSGASIQLQDGINWGGATYGTQNKPGIKILGSKTTGNDGMAQWYTPTDLGLSGGSSGVTSIVGNSGITVSPTTGPSVNVTLSGTDYYGATCTNGQILKKDASNRWTCSADSTGSGGGITGSGKGWTIPVFGGSAGVAGQTTITDSPVTIGYSSTFQDISTMVVNMFPSSLWGTKTNLALNVNGKIKVADGTQGTNKILASDANGLATWRTSSELGLGSLRVESGHGVRTVCRGIDYGGVCSTVPYIDVIFSRPFNSIPHVIASGEHVTDVGGTVGFATDTFLVKVENITT
ncbi:TPA: hypothetical protein DDZ75_00660, partial [Patescibacteria group bacterium]|nr:hypothetical protein [Patescibacteria group bacterium]